MLDLNRNTHAHLLPWYVIPIDSRGFVRTHQLGHYFIQKSIKLPQNGHVNGSSRTECQCNDTKNLLYTMSMCVWSLLPDYFVTLKQIRNFRILRRKQYRRNLRQVLYQKSK